MNLQLTEAQQRVADLVLLGHTNQEIADEIKVTEKTVKYHITSILRIANCDSRHRFIARYYKAIVEAYESTQKSKLT